MTEKKILHFEITKNRNEQIAPTDQKDIPKDEMALAAEYVTNDKNVCLPLDHTKRMSNSITILQSQHFNLSFLTFHDGFIPATEMHYVKVFSVCTFHTPEEILTISDLILKTGVRKEATKESAVSDAMLFCFSQFQKDGIHPLTILLNSLLSFDTECVFIPRSVKDYFHRIITNEPLPEWYGKSDK